MPIPTSASYVLIRSSLSGLGSGDGFSPTALLQSRRLTTALHNTETPTWALSTHLISSFLTQVARTSVFNTASLKTTINCEHDLRLRPIPDFASRQTHTLVPCTAWLPSTW